MKKSRFTEEQIAYALRLAEGGPKSSKRRLDTVAEYTAEAKASLGTWDTRFDDDYAAWLAAQPPALPPVCPPSC